MIKKAEKKEEVVKSVETVIAPPEPKPIKKKTLEELDRNIKWIRTEIRPDAGSARACVRRDRKLKLGHIYKCIKVPDVGYCILIYGRKKEDYENISMGIEWMV